MFLEDEEDSDFVPPQKKKKQKVASKGKAKGKPKAKEKSEEEEEDEPEMPEHPPYPHRNVTFVSNTVSRYGGPLR